MLLNTCVKSPSRGDGRNESFGVRINERTRFQSTRPSWGATESFGRLGHVGGISIHAPLVGRDDGTGAAVAAGLPFQSTRPSGDARYYKFLKLCEDTLIPVFTKI